jgi:peptidoglycan/LPS O-acetylase OafA/YrhL
MSATAPRTPPTPRHRPNRVARMRAADRLALGYGIASLVSAVFVATHGDPWEFVTMTAAAAAIALGCGALACAGGILARRGPQLAAGAVLLAAAVVVLLELAVEAAWIGGKASTLSLWLGLGVGLLGTALAPRDPAQRDR